MGCVYIIAAHECRRVKIGRSSKDDAGVRLRQLQPGSPVELSLEHVFFFTDDLARIEKHVHVLLGDRRLHNEWFNVTIGEAIRAIEIAHEKRVCRPLKPMTGRTSKKHLDKLFSSMISVQTSR